MQQLTAHKARQAGIEIEANTFISPRGKISRHKSARVQLADNVWLSSQHYLEVQEGATVTVGSRVHFGERFRLLVMPGAVVTIQDDCWLNHDISIVARTKITIGNDCLFGPYCYLSDHNHGTARGSLIRLQEYSAAPLIIGSDVWLGVGATLLKGAAVGEGAVIAARAVVSKPVPAYEIWGGVPARRLGERQ